MRVPEGASLHLLLPDVRHLRDVVGVLEAQLQLVDHLGVSGMRARLEVLGGHIVLLQHVVHRLDSVMRGAERYNGTKSCIERYLRKSSRVSIPSPFLKVPLHGDAVHVHSMLVKL